MQSSDTPPALRLGDAVTPLNYVARLVVDPARDDFDGEISIDLRINKPAKTIWLNATEIKISSAKIELASLATSIALKAIAGGDDFIGLQADSELPAGNAKITIQYRGKLEPLATYGLFKQKSGNDLYVVSQFEAYDARRAFPCFDEPGWKTPWQITLDVPAPLVAVSNTPQLAEAKLPNNGKRLSFAPTPPLPAYLIAMAIGPFDVVDGGTAGMKKTPLRYLTPKGRGAEARYARENTPRILELLENYFGTAYPYEKLDSVTIPQTVGFGAMENVGMITYAGQLLLAKPHEESDNFRQTYASVAAHEISHQWFGNLVTMKWWDDVWLNEAFATWLGSNKITYQFNPEWDDGWSRAQQRERAIDSDRLASTRRVRNPADKKDDIWAAFDSITYQKGGAVLEMFEASMKPERFREGVRLHMKNHANSNATMEDFVGALSAASGEKSLVAAFSGFIEQPGVPLIDVKLDCTAAPTLVLQQSRLKPVGSKVEAKETWNTPACFSFSENGKVQQQCGDVPNGTSRMALNTAKACPDWAMGNAQGVGYYVTRYDAAMQARLKQHALNLPAPEAIAMLSDAVLLTESGLQSAHDALALGAAQLGHKDSVVQQVALELLKSVRAEWLSPAQRQTYAQIMREQVVPQATRLTWLDQRGDSERVRRLRETALPLATDLGEDSNLRSQATALARAWLSKRDAVPAGMVDAVLNTAGAFANVSLFEAMEQQLLTIEDSGDRHKLLTALAHVRDPVLHERALALALNDKVNGREAENFLLEALRKNPSRAASLHKDHYRAASFAYIRKNFDALATKVPQHRVAQFMLGLERMCSSSERDSFVDFFSTRNSKYEGGPLIYTQSLEKIELCIAARAGNENNIKQVGIK
ncbi:MAG: M1 family metallopeptidase [Burkholderiales bacterium]